MGTEEAGASEKSDKLTGWSGTVAQYPQRKAFFSHRVSRLLIKSAAAMEIGPEGCWLILVIASTEDAKRYKGPVLYWNDQLSILCGFGGRRRLVNARQRAIDAGWLHYEEGAKGRAGKYWVIIPASLEDLDDRPTDEDPDEIKDLIDQCRSISERNDQECRSISERQADGISNAVPFRNGKRTESELKAHANRTASAHHSFPNTNPNPIPEYIHPPEPVASEIPDTDGLMTLEQEFVAYWNSTEGVILNRGFELTAVRRPVFRDRLRETGWDWRTALAKFPLKLFASDPTGFRPSVDWFLKPDTVQKILEGQFDWSKNSAPPKAGNTYDHTRPVSKTL